MNPEELKTIEVLLLKLGDDDEYLLKSKFQRLVDIISKLTDHSTLHTIYSKIRLFIEYVPGKSNIYASFLTVFQSTHLEFIEEIFNDLTEELNQSINTLNQITATNILLFFMESVKVGLINTIAFISVLMDLVNAAELKPKKLKFIVRLIETVLPGIKHIFVEKYELEYKNLTDDLQKILSDSKVISFSDLSEEKEILESIKKLPTNDQKWSLFNFLKVNLSDNPSNSKPIRKTFKISFEHLSEDPNVQAIMTPSIQFFKKKVHEIDNQSNGLNAFAINNFIFQILYSFKSDPELLIDRLMSYPWNEFEPLKNWLFLENIVNMLSTIQSDENLLFVSNLLAISIEQYKFKPFFEEALEEISIYIKNNLNQVNLSFLIQLIRCICFINLKVKSSFSLSTDKFTFDGDFYYFVNMFYSLQSRGLDWKIKLTESEHSSKYS